jgi:DNA-binding transcriptional ArsR family regulator
MVERSIAAPPPDPGLLDSVFRALADRTRRGMLRRLGDGDRTISDLAGPCAMSFAAASKHVRVLERAGLVRRTVRGREHFCRLEARPLGAAQGWLAYYQQFWNERLDALDRELTAGRKRRARRVRSTGRTGGEPA